MSEQTRKYRSFSLIGYGRFGKLWADILSGHGRVFVYEKDPVNIPGTAANIQFTDLYTALKQEVIFLCIPISAIEPFLRDHASRIPENATVIEMASVKSLPGTWMDRHIPGIRHLGVHPLFGPDSYDNNQARLMVITPSEQYPGLSAEWDEILTSWRFHTKILSPEVHDKSIAYSQGITHFIGNVLKNMGLPESATPTRGYNMLRDVERFCSNDTSQLFRDMLLYNPHSMDMFRLFLKASHEVSACIRRENVQYTGPMTLGVMGEEGSFSHEAGKTWLKNKHIHKGKISCLTTAEKVYDALRFGLVQTGLLPVQNAVGGMVIETVEGLARYNCKISGFFPFPVVQCLLGRRDVKAEKPRALHSHPQALRQCRDYLAKHYPGIPLVEEEDTAVAARKLAAGELPRDAMVIASEVCVERYQLKLIDKNIQDLAYNVTDFITVVNN